MPQLPQRARVLLHTSLALSLPILAMAGCNTPTSPVAATGASALGPNAGPEAEASQRQYTAVPTELSFASATATSNQDSAASAIDGNPDTAWKTGKGKDTAITMALAEATELTELQIKLRTHGSYHVDLSLDGKTWQSVLSNQRAENHDFETKRLPAATQAKFVRVRITDRRPSDLYEVIPVGLAASPTPAPSTAPTASPSPTPTTAPSATPAPETLSAEASSTNGTYAASRAVDGDITTDWQSAAGTVNPTLVVDRGAASALTTLGVQLNPGVGYYSVETSSDGTNYQLALSYQQNTTSGLETKTLPANTTARYMRFRFPFNAGTSVRVFEVVPNHAAGTTPTPAPSASASAAPTPAPTAAPSSPSRPLVTTPVRNLGHWDSGTHQPQNRTARLALSPDGSKVGLIWQHNGDAANVFNGEPTAYASIGDPASPGSFSSPTVVGRAPFDSGTGISDYYQNYNVRHNQGLIVATPSGGFLGLSLPMNTNGWAEGISATGYGFVTADSTGTGWSAPGLAKLRSTASGSSVSESSGGVDGDGNVHLFGQGHLGAFGGGMGYMRRATGDSLWDTVGLATAWRNPGVIYFLAGSGHVSPTRNAQGHFDIHAAFAYNKAGGDPMYGMYYLVSHDSGKTWKNASGSPVSLPLKYGQNESVAAVIPAQLSSTSFSGSSPGACFMSVSSGPDREPLIIRPTYVTGTSTVQNTLYTRVNGSWVSVPVGYPVFWNTGGTHVTYNSKTGNVNVVLLDPGSTASPGKVLLYSQPLADVRAGKSNWKQELVASAANSRNYASSLRVAEVKDTRFSILFEPSYANPGRVSPLYVEAPIR